MGEVHEGRQATEIAEQLAEIQARDAQRQVQAPGEMRRCLLYAPRGNASPTARTSLSYLFIAGKGKRSMCFVMSWDGGSL